jgi:hypothetical protein
MRRKKTIRRFPKNTAQLALALRDIALGLRRAEKYVTLVAEYESYFRSEEKMRAFDEARTNKYKRASIDAGQADFLDEATKDDEIIIESEGENNVIHEQ